VKVDKVTPEMAAQAQARRQKEQVEIDRYNQQLNLGLLTLISPDALEVQKA
jgi:hypothetical protein